MSDTTTPAERAEIDRITDLFHDALDAVPHSIHGREADWVDGSGEAVAVALVAAGWTPPDTSPSERIDPGAEQARRDDLARDVARLWAESKQLAETDADMRNKGRDMEAALDRLAAVYGEQP